MSRWLNTILNRLGLSSRKHAHRTNDDEVNAWLDARDARRSNDKFIDAMLRDPSVLDDLARQRPWMDELAKNRGKTPDHSSAVLQRLGLSAQGSRGSHRYASVKSRRPILCAVCVGAFSFGMWARSQDYLVNNLSPATGVDEKLANLMQRVPADLQPLGQVQNMIVQMGGEFSTPLASNPVEVMPIYASHHSTDESYPAKPHVAQSGAWFDNGASASLTESTQPSPSIDKRPITTKTHNADWDRLDVDSYERYEPVYVDEEIEAIPVDYSDDFDAVSNLGHF